MGEKISPNEMMLMQAEIQEAIEKIVRKRVGWKSFHFNFGSTPQIWHDESSEVAINISVKARDTGNDVIEVDHRKRLLEIKFLTD